jgi:annexin A7/11
LFDFTGEGKWGTDEEVFNKVFSHSSQGQLKLVFQEYKNVSGGRCIEEALRSELDGEMLEGIMTIGTTYFS